MDVATAGAVRCPLCGAENETVGTCRICAFVFDHPLVRRVSVPVEVVADAADPVEETVVADRPPSLRAVKRRRRVRKALLRGTAMAVGAAVVVAVAIAIPVLVDRVYEPSSAPSDETARGGTEVWVDFADPDGSFAVRLPRTPERAETIDLSATGRVTTISYVARNGVSAVGVSKVVVAADALFDPAAAAAATAQSLGATLTVTASGTDSSGRSYVEGRIENDTVHLVGRWIANGQTGYVLQVVTSFEAPDPATFTRLLASFQITR